MDHGSLRNFDLNLLVVLNAILQHQSVSLAAEELGMSQSSASHALTRLRTLLGDELFVKTRNRMLPTPKALELVEPVSEILDAVHGMLIEHTAFRSSTARRKVTLALGDVGETLLLPPLLDYLRLEAPDCSVQTISNCASEAEELLLGGKLDVYVGYIASTSSNLMCQRLYDDDLVVLCAKGFQHEGALSLDDYLRADHVAHQALSQPKNVLDQFLEDQGYQRKARVTTPNSMATPDILLRDPTLISVYPRALAMHLAEIYPLKVLEIGFDQPKVQVFQYWHRRYHNEAFASWLRKSIFDISQKAASSQFMPMPVCQ